MERIELTQDQKRDFGKSLIEKIKEFFREYVHPENKLHGETLDDALLSKADSDEERETLAEIMEEIETFHTKRKEFEQSGKTIDDWYNKEIEKSVRELNQDASRSDIDNVKEAVAKQIDGEIEETIQVLDELNGIINKEGGKEASL